MNSLKIDANTTLFIDRDGVINHEREATYVLNWNEFKFYDTTLPALKILAQKFKKIIVVTNQKGVGKKLMTEADLQLIHQNMVNAIQDVGGRIDDIYYCTDLDDNSPNRKPNPGMAFQAKNNHPLIDLSNSIMVGNKLSDMYFGKNAGMQTVFLATTNPETPFPHTAIDARFSNLLSFAESLK
jgi:histidinol-phosphate phosphatase family protein